MKSSEITIIENGVGRTFIIEKPSAWDSLRLVTKIGLAFGAAGLKTTDNPADIIVNLINEGQKALMEKEAIALRIANGESAESIKATPFSIESISGLLKAFLSLDYFLIEPILLESQKYIKFKVGAVNRPANFGDEGDIEDYKNLFKLYSEFYRLTLGF